MPEHSTNSVALPPSNKSSRAKPIGERSRRIASEVLCVGSGQILAALGGLIGVRFLTHLLPPAEYGSLALAMTVASTVHLTIFSPITSTAQRYFSIAAEKHDLCCFQAAMRRLVTKAVLLVLLLALCAAPPILLLGKPNATPSLLVGTLLFAIASGLSTICDAIQNAARQRVIVAFHQAALQWSRFAGALLLGHLIAPLTSVAMWGYSLASCSILFSQRVFLFRALGERSSRPTVKPPAIIRMEQAMGTYGWPFVIWGACAAIQTASDRWALELFSGTAEVGQYQALYQLGFGPSVLLCVSMLQLATPFVFDRAGDGQDPGRVKRAWTLLRKLLILSIGLTILGTATVAALGSWLAHVFLPPSYLGYGRVLPLLVLSGGLLATAQLAAVQQMAKAATRELLAPKVGTAVVGLLSNFIGAYAAGLKGVVWAGLLTNATYLIWVLHLCRPQSPGALAAAESRPGECVRPM